MQVKTLKKYFGTNRMSAEEFATLAEAIPSRGNAAWMGPRRVDAVLERANKVLGGYGVEAARDDSGTTWSNYYQDIAVLYVNMGDTYAPTVLYDVVAARFYLADLGWWLERRV